MNKARISVPKDRIAEFCKCNQIRRLSLFGSVLREDFGPDGDNEKITSKPAIGLGTLSVCIITNPAHVSRILPGSP